jgi:class 3 adenylate cyclase/tetratricopeptide (TPR) repeat protein
VPECLQCQTQNPPEARFCLACGSPLPTRVLTARELRKTVTVVFSDVAGSTGLSEERDPESVRRVMARYFAQARSVLERHGGTVEKFIGDAVMAVFGIPTLHEDDALRAVRAAAELRERLEDLNVELERDWGIRLETRTAVNTGEVVTGRAETLVTGDAVNVAARLEQVAAPGEVLLGEATHALVRDAVSVQPIEPMELKGKRQAVRAYRLLEVRPGVAGRERRLDSPMVGRDRQLALLLRAFDNTASERSCYLFTILGSPGVGKSRLVEEFLRSLPAETTVLRGRCLPYGEGITFWPLAEAVREAAALDEGDEPEAARAKLASLLESDENAGLIAERVAGLIGLVEATPGGEEEGLWAVRKLFERLARDQPLVVVFDDIHWGESTFLDLVEHVADWSRDAPILLICLARPELLDARPTWGGGKLNATSVLLGPLSDEESEQLIGNLLGQAQLVDEARARITEAAEGNPLFAEEMLAILIDDGLLVRQNNHWRVTADLSTVSVPPTIQALLSARLDRLDEDERSVLERASVEGKVFHFGGVVALLPEDLRPRVSEKLSMLVRRELIGPERSLFAGEEAFRFRHLLIRDAAYESIPKELRAELHNRFGAWLEEKVADRLAEYEEIVAYHLEQAYRYSAELGPVSDEDKARARRAAQLLADAARRASARGDVRAQANLLERATALLPRDEDARLELLLELGTVAGTLGDYGRAAAMLSEVGDAAAANGDRRLQHHALLELTLQQTFTDPTTKHEDVRDANARAIAVFEESGDIVGLARAWRHLGYMHQWLCEWDAEREAMERALAFAEEGQDEREARQIRTGLVNALIYGPMPVPGALERLELMLRDVRGRLYSVAYVLEGIANLRAMRGEFDEARRLIAEATSLYTELGLPFRVSVRALVSGPVELLAGDPASAEAILRSACDVLRAHGETGVFATLAGYHAEALYRLGRYDDAERATRESQEAATIADADAQARWRNVRAKIAARRGDVDLALQLNAEAAEYLERSDYLDLRGDVLLARAEVLALAGRFEEAAENITEAVRMYRQKGNIVSAERAQAELDQLRESLRGSRT